MIAPVYTNGGLECGACGTLWDCVSNQCHNCCPNERTRALYAAGWIVGDPLLIFCTGGRIAVSTPSGWTVVGESDPSTEDTAEVTPEKPKPPTNPFYPKG